MGIISGLGSFRGLFGDHFRVGDHCGVGIISGAVQMYRDPRCEPQMIPPENYGWHGF